MKFKISKIILNMGLGEDASDGKKLKACVDDILIADKTSYNKIQKIYLKF